MRTLICSGNNLIMQNLRELLEKKTKQASEVESVLSLILGYNVEEGMCQLSSSTSWGCLVLSDNSVKLQALTVKMNAGQPVHS